MDHQFIRLLPFVFAGVVIGVVFPAGMGPPPFFAGNNHQDPPPGVANIVPDIRGLLRQVMASFWDAVSAFCALSTTSRRGSSHSEQALAICIDPRAMLWSTARSHGWSELNGISLDTLSRIGTLRDFDSDNGVVIQQDEQNYVRTYIARVILDILLHHQSSAIFSPGVLDDVSGEFSRRGDVNNILSSSVPLDNEAVANFVLATIASAASLVVAIIRCIDEEPAVARAFAHFADDPTSWAKYTQPYLNSPSVGEIVRRIHHGPQSSFRVLTIVPRTSHTSPGMSSSFIRSVFDIFQTWGIAGEGNTDAEAAIGPFALHDDDIQYIAALFVAALIGYHNHRVGVSGL